VPDRRRSAQLRVRHVVADENLSALGMRRAPLPQVASEYLFSGSAHV
jgi:hypothetical protein